MSSAWKGLVNNLEKTEVPHYAYSKSLAVDSYFTSEETAKNCLAIISNYFQENSLDINEYVLIEPGVGSGSFYDNFFHSNKIGVDIVKRRDDVIECDFLKWYPDLNKKYFTIGNPPFGVRGALALAFINRSFLFSDYVAFILPMSFNSNGKGSNMKRVQNAHLVFSEVLSKQKYYSPDNNKEVIVNTLFQIWKKGNGENYYQNYDASEYIDIYTVSTSPKRVCGLDKLEIYDFFVSSTFFGENLNIVFNFPELTYGSGYGVIIKKNKKEILNSLKSVNWNNYSSLATNTCKHVRKHNIEHCFYDLGFAKIRK